MTTYALYIDAASPDEATIELANLLGTEPLPWVNLDDEAGQEGEQ